MNVTQDHVQEISGDKPLSRKQPLQYRGIFLKRFPGLFARVPKGTFKHVAIPDGQSSFFRKFVDSFLTSMIREIPQKNVRVFDIGCGGGYVRGILAREGYSGTYTGLDIVFEDRFKNFETSAFVSTFIQSPIESFSPPDRFDVVISNTSLEHVESDTMAVKKAHELRAHGGIEIHIVPSWWSFFIYLWHGYRHYTPGSLKRLFSGTNYTVYKLGGLFSFIAQILLFTIPERYCKTSFRTKNWYPGLVRKIAVLDRYIPLCPVGYGIVVHE